jgi:hypothetical protein
VTSTPCMYLLLFNRKMGIRRCKALKDSFGVGDGDKYKEGLFRTSTNVTTGELRSAGQPLAGECV